MTVLTAASDERFAVSRIELDRAGPTYTSDTLEQLKEFFGPSTQAFFIVGSDVVASLGTWRNLKRLRDLVEFIAVTRPGRDAEVEVDASWPTVHRLDVKGLEVSSTEVRERVRQKRSIDGLVAPDVAAYIGRRRLYRGEEEAGGA
jgi:nicotinate-nucleotide adenylyltransferase